MTQYRFRLTGVPPDQAIKLIEVDPNQSVAEIKKTVQREYKLNPILAIVAILSSIMLLAVFVKIFYSVFLGPELPQFKDVKESPKSMLIAMGILTCIIIFFGLFPDLIINNIVEPAANALINYQDYISHVVTGGL